MSGVSNATTFTSSNTKTVRIGHTTQIINPVLSTNLNFVPIRSTFAWYLTILSTLSMFAVFIISYIVIKLILIHFKYFNNSNGIRTGITNLNFNSYRANWCNKIAWFSWSLKRWTHVAWLRKERRSTKRA